MNGDRGKGAELLLDALKRVATIGESAFDNCRKLRLVHIPDSVVCIGILAFAWCESLTQLTLPPNLSRIANGAFHSCSNLHQLVLPAGVTVIEICGMSWMSALKEITIPPAVAEIQSWAFDHSCLARMTITANTTTLAVWSFSECNRLAFVTIPADMKKADAHAFFGVKNITRVELTGTSTSPHWSRRSRQALES